MSALPRGRSVPVAHRLAPLDTAAVPLATEDARSRPGRLLLAAHEVVPFVGREADVADLERWMTSPDRMAVRLLRADGGQGKTRIARHLAARFAGVGWTVRRAVAAADRPGDDPPGPSGLLVVVEHAERLPLAGLLTDLRTLGLRHAVPVRVLLLSRSAGPWFAASTGDLTLSTQELRPPGDRVGLFRLAATHFAERLGIDAGPPPVPAFLDSDAFGTVLAVGMAALVGVDARDRGVDPPLAPDELSRWLLDRERDHWAAARSAGRISATDDTMRRAVYVATLTGPVGRDKAHVVLGRAGLTAVVDDHRLCYPPEDGADTVLHPLRPDRLGEDLIGSAEADTGADAGTARRLLDPGGGPVHAWMAHGLAVLVETAHRWPRVRDEVVAPLVRGAPALAVAAVARLVELPGLDTATLEAVEAALPGDARVELAALSGVLTARRLAATDDPADRARILGAHAGRLGLAGRTAEAWEPAAAAVDLYRTLAARDPATYRQPLAKALVSASLILVRLGTPRPALPYATEATALLRRPDGRYSLVEAQYVTTALIHEGSVRTELGDVTAGLAATEEAVRLLRQARQAAPDMPLDNLARALTDSGNQLARLGRRSEALVRLEEAVVVRRVLAAARPSAHAAGLAGTLDELADRLDEVGRRVEAVAFLEEAVAVRRWAAGTGPDADPDADADLAAALTRQASALARVKRTEDALPVGAEAVALFRALAAGDLGAHGAGLAAALTDASLVKAQLGRLPEAAADAEEAVALLRLLAGERLASALVVLGGHYAGLGRVDDALAATAEGVESLRGQGGVEELVLALTDLSDRQAAVGLHAEALATAQEAVHLVRQPAARENGAFEPALAQALTALTERLAAAVTSTPPPEPAPRPTPTATPPTPAPAPEPGPTATPVTSTAAPPGTPTAAPPVTATAARPAGNGRAKAAPTPREKVDVRLGFLRDVELGGGEVLTRDGRRGRRYSPAVEAVPVVRLECRAGAQRAIDRGFRQWGGLIRDLTHLTGWTLTPTERGLAVVDPSGAVVAEGDTPLPDEWLDAVARQQRALVLLGPRLGVGPRSAEHGPAQRWRELRDAQRNGLVAAGLVPWWDVRS